MKLASLLLSAGLLAFGAVKGSDPFMIAGAALFILTEAADLVATYRAAKSFRDGTWEPEAKESATETAASWLRGLIILAGLWNSIGLQDKVSGLTISGGIIWFGTIICWIISGWLARYVAGIPVKMGYGGWYVHRPRGSRRRRNRR